MILVFDMKNPFTRKISLKTARSDLCLFTFWITQVKYIFL